MAFVGNAVCSSEFNHRIHHITRTCEAETNLVSTLEYELCCLDEVLRTFLHGDTSKVSNNLLVRLLVRHDVEILL